jgi:cardiolipin synthase
MRLYDLGGDGSEQVSDRILTVPNLLSLARLLILPFVYVELASGRLARGLLVGMVFGATDWLDGYVARRYDQVTRLGQLLDPLSDRLFIMTIAVALVVSGLLPWWLVAAVVVRDVALLVAGTVMLRRGARPPAVTRLGKTATFGLMWAFVPLIASGIIGTAEDPQPVLWWIGFLMLLASVVLYWATAVDYGRQLRAARGAADD